MTADTITPERIETLAQYLSLASRQMRKIIAEAERGDITPADAAADVRILIRAINALAETP
jgi:hypothetical protein